MCLCYDPRNSPPACIICQSSNLLSPYKCLSNNTYCHILCALSYFNRDTFNQITNFNKIECDRCSECDSNDIMTLKCHEKDCNSSFHPICIINNSRFQIIPQFNDKNILYNYNIYCEKHIIQNINSNLQVTYSLATINRISKYAFLEPFLRQTRGRPRKYGLPPGMTQDDKSVDDVVMKGIYGVYYKEQIQKKPLTDENKRLQFEADLHDRWKKLPLETKLDYEKKFIHSLMERKEPLTPITTKISRPPSLSFNLNKSIGKLRLRSSDSFSSINEIEINTPTTGFVSRYVIPMLSKDFQHNIVDPYYCLIDRSVVNFPNVPQSFYNIPEIGSNLLIDYDIPILRTPSEFNKFYKYAPLFGYVYRKLTNNTKTNSIKDTCYMNVLFRGVKTIKCKYTLLTKNGLYNPNTKTNILSDSHILFISNNNWLPCNLITKSYNNHVLQKDINNGKLVCPLYDIQVNHDKQYEINPSSSTTWIELTEMKIIENNDNDEIIKEIMKNQEELKKLHDENLIKFNKLFEKIPSNEFGTTSTPNQTDIEYNFLQYSNWKVIFKSMVEGAKDKRKRVEEPPTAWSIRANSRPYPKDNNNPDDVCLICFARIFIIYY